MIAARTAGPGAWRSGFLRYGVLRILWGIPTLLGIVVAVFLLLHLVPGEPGAAAGVAGNRRVSREAVIALRRLYGLDRPLAAQMASWLGRVARLDFGESFQDHRPVSRRLGEALPYTLELNVLALLLTLAIAIPLGVQQARHRGSAFDRVSGSVLFALYSMPSFWMAMLLLTLFASRLGWLPLFGVVSDRHDELLPAAALLDSLKHLALPLACLTYGSLAFFTRMVRAAVLEAAGKDFVLAARARGATPSQALWRHAFRNALLPMLTLTGLMLPGLLSGSVIIERIFAWPGLGRLYFDAVLARDYPVILGLTFCTAVMMLVATLLADIACAAADPRLRDRVAGG